MPHKNPVASAPGKVLIIGGYLVVESPNVGISIGVDARFETEINENGKNDNNEIIDNSQLIALMSSNAATYKDCFAIRARSPQFKKSFTFFVKVVPSDNDKKQEKIILFQDPSFEGAKNPFLAHAILYTLSFVCTTGTIQPQEETDGANASVSEKLQSIFPDQKTRILNITVRGANDFYSQQNHLKEKNLPINTASLRQVPPFADLIGEVSKTGLGSSAALTTSVVGALFSFARFQVFPHGSRLMDVQQERECIHRIAQSAHCVAQGKVGSGFDVYTACFGTCAYTRFPAQTIEPLMLDKAQEESSVPETDHLPNQLTVTLATLKSAVGDYRHNDKKQTLSSSWVPNAVIPSGRAFTKSGLPKNIKLVLGDVHAGGSETPGMVQKIFAWRKTQDNADPSNLWNQTAQANINCIEALLTLIEIQKANEDDDDNDNYQKTVTDVVSKLPGNDDKKWETALEADKGNKILEQFDLVRRSFRQCRVSLRTVGEKAGVEVEPPKLTGLLDATISNCPGVLAVGCPGAGGYDAVFALVVEGEEDKSKSGAGCEQVEKFWESYSGDGLKVCPLLVRESDGGLSW